MKLQVAIDLGDTNDMLELVAKIHDIADIIEIGTPLIIRDGLRPVRELRDKYKDVVILADTKIMDGGALEAAYALNAGADIVTVLAAAPDETIKAVIDATHQSGKETLVDMINCKDFLDRALEVEALDADYIGVHTASDVQGSGKTPIDELRIATEVIKTAKVAVAGGIGLDTLAAVVTKQPAIVIAGSKITGSPDPRATILAFKEVMDQETER